MSGIASRYPFTAAQWQELEHQALFFKFMVSGLPIPPDLIFSINGRKSLTSHPDHRMGWTNFQLGMSQNIDPEPTRCRRTDGKKWRCSRLTTGDSKYCERHMHRGKSRPRRLSVPDSKAVIQASPHISSSTASGGRKSNSNLTTSVSSATSDMAYNQSHLLFNTHVSKPVKESTFMTFLGIETGWSPPKVDKREKREMIMYQFMEESPSTHAKRRRDSWLNLVI